MPGHKYNLVSEFDNKSKGRTFGLPYSYYSKTYLPENDIISPEVAKEIPGPGNYKVNPDNFVGNLPKISLKFRIKNNFKNDVPAPNHYYPKTNYFENNRFKNISFGISARNSLKINNDFTPGPNSYILPSAFDKFKKNKYLEGFDSKEILKKIENKLK